MYIKYFSYSALFLCMSATAQAEPPVVTKAVTQLPTLSPTIPLEITATPPFSLESLQHDFDDFSWQSFIALNWPAKADGSPDSSINIGQEVNRPVVWLHWKESRDIFLADGAKPPRWDQSNSVPNVCKSIDQKTIPKGAIYLSQVGKTPNVLDESGEPFTTGPLIDQNGLYTRYEILTNETMFNFILDNNLYSKKGQKQFNADVDFTPSDSKTGQIGSIMLKAAWIKMGGKFDPKNYYTTYALVYNNPEEQHGVEAACSLEQVGLVGFHIAHKTTSEPQWIWSTFEHVANVPTKGETASLSAYNFYNPSCTNCKINEPPARPWDPANLHSKPTQVERIIPLTADAKALNTRYHAALDAAVPGSVWVNYQLVSTQWPTDATNPTDPTGVPAPSFLANTTLETYIQGSVKQTSSSCMACHNNAATTNGNFADFTYLLQRAQ
ncbi:hypothetical protein ACWXWU_06695 [Shewanella sp. A14]